MPLVNSGQVPSVFSKEWSVSNPLAEADLLNQVHDAINATDPSGFLIAWNAAAEKLYGYATSEVIGRHVSLLMFPEDLPFLEREIFEPLLRNNELELTVRNRRKDGSPVFVSLRLTVIRDEAGEVVRMIGCSNDITEHKRAEDALRQEIQERRRVEAALRASEQQLNHLLADNPAVLFTCDPIRNYAPTFVSPNIEALYGYTPEAFLGDSRFWFERVHPDDAQRVWQEAISLGPGATGAFEYRFRHSDGSYKHVRVTAAHRYDENGRAIQFIGNWLDITAEKEAEESRREQDRLRYFTEALLSTQDAIRKRISRELHDDLNQRLATIILEIGLIEQTTRDAQLRANLKSLKDFAAGISDEVRRIAMELHTAGLEQFGLAAVLQQECTNFAARTGIQVDCGCSDGCVSSDVPEAIALNVYRVAQECLRNVFKHSQSKRIEVSLKTLDSVLYLRVRDWGVGFDMRLAKSKQSLGLVIMDERMRHVGGSVQIQTRPGEGTEVLAKVPLANAAEQAKRVDSAVRRVFLSE